MLFSKKGEVGHLIQLHTADCERLAALQRKLRDLEPRWSELQDAAERVAASLESWERTGTRACCELFWSERLGKLQDALAQAVTARDTLTVEIDAEIKELKNKTYLRHSSVVTGFWSWIQTETPKLPRELAAELLEDYQAIQRLEDMGEIVASIKRSVARVEAAESPVYLLDVRKLVSQACEAA